MSQNEQNGLSGVVHPSPGPGTSPPGYYVAIHLDAQEPWPAWLGSGTRVRVVPDLSSGAGLMRRCLDIISTLR